LKILITTKRALALFFILYSFSYSLTLDEIIEQGNISNLTKYIKNVTVYYDANKFPDNPKNNDLAILEDEYNVQIVYEYKDDNWNERTDKILAKILNENGGISFSFLLPTRAEPSDFKAYITDTKRVVVDILISKSNKINLTNNINEFMMNKKIKQKDIINIQIEKVDEKTSRIIIIYKY
jgi:NAD(P)H-flavin reductase